MIGSCYIYFGDSLLLKMIDFILSVFIVVVIWDIFLDLM